MAAVARAARFGALHPVRLVSSYITSFAGLSVVLCFVVGTLLLAGRIRVNRRWRGMLLGAIGIIAALVLIPFAAATDGPGVLGRLFFRVAVRAGLSGAAMLFGAVVVFRVSSLNRGTGGTLVISALCFLAVNDLTTFGVHLLAFLGMLADTPGFLSYLSSVEFLIEILLGLGMVIWLLEEEQRRAMRSADERELLQAQLNQSQRLESVGRLAGGVAHDFNNLLTAIVGNADLIEQWSSLSGPSANALEQIKSASERASGLTRQLLAFAKRQPIEPTVVDLNELIRSARDLLTRLVREDVRIETALAPAPVVVEVDKVQVEQVLVNLVVNARDAMPQGGTITIGTETRRDQNGDWSALWVTDLGTGITEGDLGQIFEPFFSTKAGTEGVGLGLATSHGIITNAGGRIEVETRPGAGSTFRVLLPRSGKPLEVAGTAEYRAPSAGSGAETIMVVEDDQQVRNLLRVVLEGDGYNLLVAEDGVAALEMLGGSEKIDLLVTDTVMPRMGGVELAARLAEIQPGIRVIPTSGYTGDSSLGALPGAVFLAKPFTPNVLIEAVRSTLDAA